MVFQDETDVVVRGGDGGDGCVSFLSEPRQPRGGPDGGDGGDGGDVILRATRDLRTLGHLEDRDVIEAEDGQPGGERKKRGSSGADEVIEVPVGTVVKDYDNEFVLKDLNEDGQELVIAEGGEGGRGNVHFATSTNQAPRQAEEGTEGENRRILLSLKLLADAGLVGLPNAGKSTLLSALSDAHPEQAAYPFTTIYPVIGMIRTPDYQEFIMADLPGLIEGAHRGKGLGDRFLRHIERTSVLVHTIDVSPMARAEPLEAYRTIREELESYHSELIEKPEIIAANKMDLEGSEEGVKQLRRELDRTVIPVSAATEQGLDRLKYAIMKHLDHMETAEESGEGRERMFGSDRDGDERTEDGTD